MKNIVIVDIDTDREKIVQIGKTKLEEIPDTLEKAKDVLLTDISCLIQGISTLILTANESGIKTKEELFQICVNQLEDNLELNSNPKT